MKIGAAGSIIANRFQLVAQVATGGMGTVHRAVDLTRQRAVAIKLLTDIGSAEAGERFRREANVLAELRHPGIVEFVDAGFLDDGGMYLAMQWLEGMDLSSKLLSGPLSGGESVKLVRAIAEALSAAHARGILHRDVKPQNVFLREGDCARPVLLDFGIATLAGMTTGITRTGLTIGTPGFMAPEQARGERVLDARVDVYGLGCLLFQCMTGSPPFVGPTPVAIVAEVLLSTAPRLRSRVPDVPAELDDLVASMLAKDANQRPRDGNVVAQRLGEIESTLKLSTKAGAPAVSGEERRMIAVVCVVMPPATASAPSSDHAATEPMRGTFLPKLAAEYRGDLQLGPQGLAFMVFTSDESITEAATRAGAAAIGVTQIDPNLLVALAIGPSQVRSGLDGMLVERLASMAVMPGVVMADATSRGVLLAKFVFSHVERGYRLLASRAVDEPARLAPFVGRDRELRALADMFEAVIEERAARAALVVGGIGLGKSRLLRELFVRVEQRSPPPALLDARAEPMRKDAPLSLLGQLVRRGLTVVDGAAADEQTALLRAAIERLVPAHELGRTLAFLSVAADVAPGVDAPPGELAAARRDPQLMEDQIGRAFGAVLAGLCQQSAGAAVIVDDAQWTDLVSARILGRVIRRMRDLPVCLIAFARPELDDRLTRALGEVPLERIQLGGLPKRAAEKLVRDALGSSSSDDVVARIVQQSEGNPLFLQELVGFAVEQRLDTIPTGVLASLEGRLLRLEPTARKVLRAASVFGETFWHGGVVMLLGENAPEVQVLNEWLVFLVEKDILAVRRTTRFPREAEFSFRHSLMRDVAYTMLTPEDRARAHRLAAVWLERNGEKEPAVLATHLDAAGEAVPAASYWARAGRLSYERNDANQALACVDRALRQGLGGRERAEALVLMTNAYVWIGQLEKAIQRGQEAVASFIAGTQGWVEAVSALVRALGRTDELAAIDAMKKLVEAVRNDPSLKPVPETLSNLVPIALRRGMPQLAADLVDVLGEAALAHAPSDPAVRANILRCRSWQVFFDWNSYGCLQYDREALENFRAAGDRRQVCTSYFDVGFDYMMLGAYERAEHTFNEALAEARRLGIDGLEYTIEHNLSFVLNRLGRSEEAVALQRECVESAMRRSDRVGEAHARHYLAIMLHELGDIAGSEIELERTGSCIEALSIRWDTLARLGFIALERGNLPLARLRIEEAVRGMREVRNAEEGEMYVWLALVELARAEHDPIRAKTTLMEAKTKLMVAADRIEDSELKSHFLTRLPEHKRLLELAAELGV